MKLTYEAFAQILENHPTEEQEKVIRSEEPSILVVAGAGSGKTATMSQRIAWHVARGHVRPDEVLGLTFTRKAAGELATRVMGQLAAVKARFGVGKDSEETSENDNKVADAIHASTARPTILTYNSFASQLASSYAMLIGEDPRSRLIQEAERWQIMEKIVSDSMDDVLLHAGYDPASDESPLADRSLSSIISDSLALSSSMIDNGVSTRELIKQLEEENAFASELAAVKFRVPPNTFAEAEENTGLPAKKAWDQLKKIGRTFAYRSLIVEFVERYFSYKKANSLAEFADQVAWASRILESHERVREEIAGRYRLVILDEYQDTSVNQARFLHLVFGGHAEGWRSICAVGDPNQAIYSWRGASANALSDFTRDFAVAPHARLTLSVAFRNGKNILDAANLLTHGQRGKLEYGERLTVKELVAGPVSRSSSVDWVHAPLRGESATALVKAVHAAMGKIDREQATKGGKPASAAILCRKRKYVPSIIAALEAEGVPYEAVGGQSLMERKEVRLVRALLTLTVSPARNSALVPLLNFFAIGTSDLRELGKVTRERKDQSLLASLEWILHNPADVRISEEGMSRLARLGTVLEQMRLRRLESVPQAVQSAIDLLDLEMYAAAMRRGNRMMSALGSFASMAHQYAATADSPSLEGFVAWIDLVEEKENQGEESTSAEAPMIDEEIVPEGGVVQVLTVHAAKGLEWDVVGVPEMNFHEFDTEKHAYDVWQTTSSMLPYPLRQDREYLPSFEVAGHFRPGEFERVARGYSVDKDADARETLKAMLVDLGSDYASYRYGEIPEHAAAEERRLAYVAFTRPKRVLILASYDFTDLASAKKFADAWEKKGEFAPPERGQFLTDVMELLPQSASGNIVAQDESAFRAWAHEVNLASVRVGQPVLAASEEFPTWPADVDRSLDRVQVKQRETLGLSDEERSALISQWNAIVEGFLPEQHQRAQVEKPHYTASDVVAVASDSSAFWRNLVRPIPMKPSPAGRLGTEVHAAIANFYDAPATLDLDSVWEFEQEETPAQKNEILLDRFRSSPYAKLQPLAIERALEIRIGGTTVRCVIDAVLDTSHLVDRAPVTIVDWKTGHRPSDALLEARVLQLQLYRLVWSRVHGVALSSIDAAFYYLGEENEENREFHPRLWSENEIIEQVAHLLHQDSQ